MSTEELERAEGKAHLVSQILTTFVTLYTNHRDAEDKELVHSAKIPQLFRYLPSLSRVLFARDFTAHVTFSTSTEFFLDDSVVGSNHLPMYADMLVNLVWGNLTDYNPQAAPLELIIGLYPNGLAIATFSWGYSLGETELDPLNAPTKTDGE